MSLSLPATTQTDKGISFLAKLVPSFSQGPPLIPGSLTDPGKPGFPPRQLPTDTSPARGQVCGTPTRATASKTRGGTSPRPCWEAVAEEGDGRRRCFACPGAGLPSPCPCLFLLQLGCLSPLPLGQVPDTGEQAGNAPRKSAQSWFAGSKQLVPNLEPIRGYFCRCVLPRPALRSPSPGGFPSLSPAVTVAALSLSSAHVSPAIKVSGEGKGAVACRARGGSDVCPRRCCKPCPTAPGQAAAGLPAVTQSLASPSACPGWLERCPKWINEPPRENEPTAIPQPASRRWDVHRTGLPDGARGPWTGLWGPRKMGAQRVFGVQS